MGVGYGDIVPFDSLEVGFTIIGRRVYVCMCVCVCKDMWVIQFVHVDVCSANVTVCVTHTHPLILSFTHIHTHTHSVMVIGFTIATSIIALMVHVLKELTHSKAVHDLNSNAIEKFMRHYDVPLDIQTRIGDYRGQVGSMCVCVWMCVYMWSAH
jgi:hypothetical protein